MSNAEFFKLFLIPQQDSYTLSRTNDGYSRVELDGGAGKYRRDIIGNTGKITVKWVLSAEEYDYIWALFRVFVADMTPFLLDLIVENAGLTECKCWVQPGTFKLNKQTATSYYCQATLEVEMPKYDLEEDRLLVWLITYFGKNWRIYFDRLNIIVNTDWYVALPWQEDQVGEDSDFGGVYQEASTVYDWGLVTDANVEQSLDWGKVGS